MGARLHTDDEFLRAIEADPRERTLRLAYADWLTEHDDPRGELIRVEEEMRPLPVFGDRFWELKPRRNQLRSEAGPEWCAKMRHGTECLPVFAHGIPDGWRERRRLIREFTERWHRVPMPDVGGRQAEIAEVEMQLGRAMPPVLREWEAFGCDILRNGQNSPFHNPFRTEPFPDSTIPAVALYTAFSGSTWFALGVHYDDFALPDPPLFSTHSEDEELPERRGCVTEAALWYVLRSFANDYHIQFTLSAPEYNRFVDEVRGAFPTATPCAELTVYELDDIFIALQTDQDEDNGRVWVNRARDRDLETLPAFLRNCFAPPNPAPASSDDIPF